MSASSTISSSSSSSLQSSSLCIPSLLPAETLPISIQSIYNFFNPNNLGKMQGIFLCTDSYDLSKKEVFILNSQKNKIHVNNIKIAWYVTSWTRWISDDTTCLYTKWTFDLNGSQEVFFTSSPPPPMPDNNFNGMELERIFPSYQASLAEKIENWNQWELLYPSSAKHYAEIIHPNIIQTIRNIHALNPSRQIKVLDLGCGSGKLGAMIVEQLSDEVEGVLMIDDNITLLEQAQEQVAKYPDKLVTKRLSLKENELTSTEFYNSSDVIVLCGVVAHQVLTKGEGMKVMEDCLPIVRDNGYVIVASYSPSLLSSAAFETIGFRVLNKTLTYYNDEPHASITKTKNFYILQKKP